MRKTESFWDDLFGAGQSHGAGLRVSMRLLRKGGRPFLLLPMERQAAVASLELYPAQTPRARLAKTLLGWCLRAGLPVGTETVFFNVSPEAGLARFVRSIEGTAGPNQAPCFGILAGNPATEGQRFLVLVFNSNQEPVSVVKAGTSERARALIQKEGAFLVSIPSGTNGIPRIGATFESPSVRALSLEFFAGHSPRLQDEGALPVLLESWVNPERQILVGETPDWARLEEAASAVTWFSALAGQLRGRQVQAAIHHGDLAPWNVKVSAQGVWTVLDWERGELLGLPGWDWFHYVLQPAILVTRLRTSGLVERIEDLIGSGSFKRYAERAGITGFERHLALAYLLHCVEVIKPSEGLAATRDLLEALRLHWAVPD